MGGKGSLRVTRRIHARIVLHGSRRIFSNWDPRKSAKKNKKEKKMVQKDPPLSSASPAFFFSQRKMEITATESLPNPSDRRSTTAFLVIPLDFNSTFDLASLSLELYRCRITRRTSIYQEPFQELIIKIISRGIKEKRNPHETLTTTRWWIFDPFLLFSFFFERLKIIEKTEDDKEESIQRHSDRA